LETVIFRVFIFGICTGGMIAKAEAAIRVEILFMRITPWVRVLNPLQTMEARPPGPVFRAFGVTLPGEV